VQLHDILKYTVYGAIIKKKEWRFFESLFDPTLFPPYQGSSILNQNNSNDISSRPVTTNTIDQPNTYIPPLDRNMLSTANSKQPQQHPSMSTPATSLTPAQRYAQRPPNTITYYTWLEGALTLCREYHVPVRHIRTQEEHEYYANVTSLHAHSYWNLEQTGIIRDFRIMRQLQVGDCVWALHHESVRWLPAVIEKIHYPDIPLAVEIAAPPVPSIEYIKDQDSWVTAVEAGQAFTNYHTNPSTANATATGTATAGSSTSAAITRSNTAAGVITNDGLPGSPDGTFQGTDSLASSQNSSYYNTGSSAINTSTLYYYDLWYPLNEKELQRSRMATTSRQLLTLPSENQVIGIPPKPYLSEKQVCAYAFDLMDHPGLGVLPISQVIEFMQSPELKQVVETSFVLSNIFRGKIIDIALENSIYNSLILEEYQQDRIGATQNRNYYTHKKKRKARKRPQRVLTNLPSLLSVFVDTFSNTGSQDEALRVGEDGLSITSGKGSKAGSKAGSRGAVGVTGLDGLDNDSIASEGSLKGILHEQGSVTSKGSKGSLQRQKSRVTIHDDNASVGSAGSAGGKGGAGGSVNNNSYGGDYSLDGFDEGSSLISAQSKKSGSSKPPSARGQPTTSNSSVGKSSGVGDALNLDMLHTDPATSHSVGNSRQPTGRSNASSAPLEGYVSKMDFLEFCEAVYNVLKYDVHKIHPKGLNTIAELQKQKPSTIKPPKKAAMRLPTVHRSKKKKAAAAAAATPSTATTDAPASLTTGGGGTANNNPSATEPTMV
jgi:hypothetical protein